MTSAARRPTVLPPCSRRFGRTRPNEKCGTNSRAQRSANRSGGGRAWDRRMVIGADEQRDVFAGRALYEGGAAPASKCRAGALPAPGRPAPISYPSVGDARKQDVPAVGPAPTKKSRSCPGSPPRPRHRTPYFRRTRAQASENRGVAKPAFGRVQHVEASAEAFRVGRAEQRLRMSDSPDGISSSASTYHGPTAGDPSSRAP